MLISYPILLDGIDNQTEEQKFAAALATELLDEGVYPVSHDGRWHGGIHINAGSEPVRAIADGEVICYRFAEQLENYPGQGDIDTSFILLKHITETGERTPVVFYSLYMHLLRKPALDTSDLSQLPRFLRDSPASMAIIKPINQKIYRKEVLGFAGMVYDRNNVLHFEIFTTDEHLNSFWKESNTSSQYGSDDVYGDMHFVIPANSTFTARHPSTPATGAHQLGLSSNSNLQLPEGTSGANTEELFVSIRFDQGSYQASSYVVRDGQSASLGEPIVISNYEYELYRQAVLLYPDCPSVGFEWLRFGRVLGPDSTAINQNFKPIRYSDSAHGYLDLAANVIRMRSDADFPHWQGWQKIDESEVVQASDSIVDVRALLDILGAADENKDGSLTAEELASHLQLAQNQATRAKLRHLVVKHPTEWDDTNVEEKYGRLHQKGKPLFEEESWNQFLKHIQTLVFWAETSLPTGVWHFHPLQFIQNFRKCGWLTVKELNQLVPKKIVRGKSAGMRGPFFYERVGASGGRLLQSHYVEINKMWRKHLVTTKQRLACFVANSVQETNWWSTTEEGNGSNLRYAPWYGRGFLQLTNPDGALGVGSNYYKYFKFRGREVNGQTPSQISQWRNDVSHEPFDAAESAGAYWSWCVANREADNKTENSHAVISLDQKSQLKPAQKIAISTNVTCRRLSCLVNYPAHIDRADPLLNGLVDRYSAFSNAQVVLFDSQKFENSAGETTDVPEDFEYRRG